MIDPKDVAFFVTGHGRSGTKWLARLLARTPDGVAVMHEPLGPDDATWYGQAYSVPSLAEEWIWFRQRKMGLDRTGGQRWGEVNSYLRYGVPGLKHWFPAAPVTAIVRDGRYVVRSMLKRGIYGKRSPPVPTPSHLTTPFLKCCWYWAETYRLLDQWNVPVFKLEDLTTDYGDVQRLCIVLEIAPPCKEAWENLRCMRINASMPEGQPLGWSPKEHEAFRRVAGDIQRRYGYQ